MWDDLLAVIISLRLTSAVHNKDPRGHSVGHRTLGVLDQVGAVGDRIVDRWIVGCLGEAGVDDGSAD